MGLKEGDYIKKAEVKIEQCENLLQGSSLRPWVRNCMSHQYLFSESVCTKCDEW